MFQLVLAYFFSGLIILGALGVILCPKPVHSVLCLIFAFLNGAALYILLGAEFLALSTLIIYVGAVSVLLLFVVMTLSSAEGKLGLSQLKPYRYWVLSMAVIFAGELILLTQTAQKSKGNIPSLSNIKTIGNLLYTEYGLIFQGCAVLLLVAMISAVIITFQSREVKFVKRQNPTGQINRNAADVVQLIKVKRGEGI